jgi:hypothetical protein
MGRFVGIILTIVIIGAAAFYGYRAVAQKRGFAPTKSVPTFVSPETERVFGRTTSMAMLSEKINMLIPGMPVILNEVGSLRGLSRLGSREVEVSDKTANGYPPHKRFVGEWNVDGSNKSVTVTFEFFQTSAGFEFDKMTMLGRDYTLSEIAAAPSQ